MTTVERPRRGTWRDLRRGLALLEVSPRRTSLAVVAATITLVSALTLAGVSAWLVLRAFEMPPVLDLTVAVVAVRALGISRGVFRYLDRLATHDVALRGTVAARTTLYQRLAGGDPRVALGVSRGRMLARTGEDIDTIADTVVRAVIPVAVAVILSATATFVLWLIAPAAAIVLAIALIVAGVFAPVCAAWATRIREEEADAHRADHRDAVLMVLDHAAELRVSGQLEQSLDRADHAVRSSNAASDRAAIGSATATAVTPLAVGASVIGSIIIGVQLYASGDIALTSLGILVLLPLAAFEAVSTLPDAATHTVRAKSAAARVMELIDRADSEPPQQGDRTGDGHEIVTTSLMWGWGSPLAAPLDATWPAGSRVVITGPSGSGKTTLLMTIAGLARPLGGTVMCGNVPLHDWRPQALRNIVTFFAEDAHIFATTIRENLRVANNAATDAQMLEALNGVGLAEWVAGLDDGLETVLVGGDEALSGGQRRRLLLARAILSPASVLLLDEPTEHLDADDSEELLDKLLDRESSLIAPHRTVIVATHHQHSVDVDQQLRILG
ncbi:thiol reductant ABC exporter subunit CydC [Hoyosella rhizosphaerae]|uniref:ATP-binding protein ABC transporter CydC n=1 Tax=Hoyosella rhizosphaerae TaxID=1755582 RepID=A0A916UH61_9ACTN|nr:thiol reductant ABC exporter subunit CydC [Hoyosella rhizosphaerae]MBN4928247.1 thiol reductant ABC exporter subunit CydC [Hoyosella rhizosphaerae]GGC73531.1 putative ATP-binding protein ABC transporter CydC [Hoyosella rhizosphaerae]